MLWQPELCLCPWRQWMEWRAAPGRLLSAPLWKAGRSAALPREPSGGRKRQGSNCSWMFQIWRNTCMSYKTAVLKIPVSLVLHEWSLLDVYFPKFPYDHVWKDVMVNTCIKLIYVFCCCTSVSADQSSLFTPDLSALPQKQCVNRPQSPFNNSLIPDRNILIRRSAVVWILHGVYRCGSRMLI